MKMSVAPFCAISLPSRRAAASSTRTVVVPTATIRLGGIDRGRGGIGNGELLLVHPVIGDFLRLDRLERSGADMKRNEVCGSFARISGVKCNPAVGAAMAPGTSAKTV